MRPHAHRAGKRRSRRSTSSSATREDNEHQNEAQDGARRALDLMARDLRNLASPTPSLPLAVDVALPQDIIFQSEGKTKDPDSLNVQNTTRVRYCLDTDEQGHLPADPDLEDAPRRRRCPGGACGATTGWNSTLSVATDVVNGTRPIFTYNAVGPRRDHRGERAALRRHRPRTGCPPRSIFRRRSSCATRTARPRPCFSCGLDARRRRLPERLGVHRPRGEGAHLRVVGCDAPRPQEGGRGDRLHVRAARPPASARCTSSSGTRRFDTTSDTKTVCANGPGVICP